MRKALLVVLIGTLCLALAYGASPFLAAHYLRRAIQSDDRDQIEAAVDFPSVQQDLREQIAAALSKSFGSAESAEANSSGPIAGVLVRGMSERIVSATVTTDGLSKLLETGSFTDPRSKSSGDSVARFSWTGSYRTFDRFRVTLNDGHANAPINLTLSRTGIVMWKLIRVEIPQDRFSDMFAGDPDKLQRALQRPAESEDVASSTLLSAVAASSSDANRIRRQVDEGLTLADEWKTKIAEFRANTGHWPRTSDLKRSSVAGNYETIELGDGAAILIHFGRNADAAITGRTLALTPALNKLEDVLWRCGRAPFSSGDVIEHLDARALTNIPNTYLPRSCQG